MTEQFTADKTQQFLPRIIHNIRFYHSRTGVLSFYCGRYYMERDYSFKWEVIYYVRERIKKKDRYDYKTKICLNGDRLNFCLGEQMREVESWRL